MSSSFEPTPPNNDWEDSKIGLPDFYIPDPPEMAASKKANWDEMQILIAEFKEINETWSFYRWMAQVGQLVPFFGVFGVAVIESMYIEILADLDEKSVILFDFFSDKNNYGDEFEYNRVMINRNRAYQKIKMEGDLSAYS